ncbi:acetate--CoA ligase family protein [Microbacterium sp. F51-2R]|uniref:acetate--CoA ligase family protein n=1 Tax=Microbacterium sp. F51-2R TaxID=3445777 RepID=UPI003F9F236C
MEPRTSPASIGERRVFDALFAPRTIALVGASSDATKHTARPQRSLRHHGYEGTIVPINPHRDVIFGEPAFPSVTAYPDEIDHAFIMVPGRAVAAVIDDCIEKGVPVATIYADGFAESGPEGKAAQDAIVERARAGGLRLLGPNCSGILSTEPSCALSVNAAIEQLPIKSGSLAIISQSGSMTGGLLSRGLGRGVGFSKVVSIGNESDLAVGELTDWLVDDPQTETILLFLETIRDAPRLAVAARRAVDAGKSVVAYKLGRSDLGRTLAASHTGAMAGSAEVSDAFFRAHGIIRIDNIETMFELPAMISGHRPSPSHRVAVMSTTGGGAATVVDRLGSFGVDIVAPPAELVTSLADRGVTIPSGPLTDLTHAGTRADVYGAVIDELAASDHCDLVLAIAGSSAQFQPEISAGPIVQASRFGKPLAGFFAPHAPDALETLTDAGVAGFRTPEACADAIRAWTAWVEPAKLEFDAGTDMSAVHELLSGFGATGPNEAQAAEVFAALGIGTARTTVIRPDHAATLKGRGLEYPVAAKVLSADIAHKTEAGGVVLGIANEAELEAAVERIREQVSASHPSAVIEGVLVQEMVKGLIEVILGFRRDPEVGPVVLLGAGGVLAEISRDISVRVAPVSFAEAELMIGEVKALTGVRGYRGLPRGDIAGLANAIVSMSQLAHSETPGVSEAEINPLLVRGEGEGVIAVDGLIVANPAP